MTFMSRPSRLALRLSRDDMARDIPGHRRHMKAELAHLKHGFLSSPEELIDEARNGRMVILVDDEDRENEGDLIIPAQMATPDAINFMARFGRGLICLCLTSERTGQLGLEPMTRKNRTRHGTAF